MAQSNGFRLVSVWEKLSIGLRLYEYIKKENGNVQWWFPNAPGIEIKRQAEDRRLIENNNIYPTENRDEWKWIGNKRGKGYTRSDRATTC